MSSSPDDQTAAALVPTYGTIIVGIEVMEITKCEIARYFDMHKYETVS